MLDWEQAGSYSCSSRRIIAFLCIGAGFLVIGRMVQSGTSTRCCLGSSRIQFLLAFLVVWLLEGTLSKISIMSTTTSIVPSGWTERFLASRIWTLSTVGLILFQIDSGRTSFPMKLGADPVCQMISNLLVKIIEHSMFAQALYTSYVP